MRGGFFVKSLTDILKEAETLGFNQEQRHKIADVYRKARHEYLHVEGRPTIRGMKEHCYIKAQGYIERHLGRVLG